MECTSRVRLMTGLFNDYIVFLAGTVYSRTIWSVFNAFFGGVDTDEENSNKISDDESRHQSNSDRENSAGKDVGGEDNNEIMVDPYTQEKKRKPTDNRVGWSYQIEGDPSTEEGYKKYLQKALEYIRNLSNQDHGLGYGGGPAYTQLHQRFGEYNNYGELLWDDGEGDDLDGGDPDYDGDFDDADFDYDYWGGHDELK
ncbi:unnamed protein product [Cylicocyclus nassatus]|uniref:Uncharacterized protein n=1 Tax=Cylicocyclus nassatus TaxID=53992 RepID=A0AA36M985_CYLNA|nr:unnamed protein product [Cylicocyclus nassatus]